MSANHPLREWRICKGWTGERLGRALGVGKSAISKYESGARRPHWEVIARIDRLTKGVVTANHFLQKGRAA